MAKKSSKSAAAKDVVTLTHDDASRKNIPTAEFESVMKQEQQSPLRVAYERRNRDLDPQLVWRGKDEQDWSDLVVPAPPLFIQEKVHPKVLIDDLKRQSEAARLAEAVVRQKDIGIGPQIDLFADFNGLPSDDAKTDFYAHDAHWANRLILGDSLQVMASLAEREGLRGKVQCIYIDPPYGIKFNSNFQWSTTTTKVSDGKIDEITREPEQVKAFRDTWRDGVHSYLSYIRDRLTVARDLLTTSGSIFVQISEENVHRLRCLMDEMLGEENFVSQISFVKTMGQTDTALSNNSDFLLWYSKDRNAMKFRPAFEPRSPYDNPAERYIFVEPRLGEMYDLTFAQKSGQAPIPEGRILKLQVPFSQTGSENSRIAVQCCGRSFLPSGTRGWSTSMLGMERLKKGGYLHVQGNSLWWKSYRDLFPYKKRSNHWEDTRLQAFLEDRVYIVQTSSSTIKNCLLMTTDPGDLVLDPTCGSGTTAYVAEQWGRRWITIDTSRVALALARARIMGARYPYYLKADSREGQLKEAEVTRTEPSSAATYNSLRQGFVYERVPHITLKSIANNAEIDVIWERAEQQLAPIRKQLSAEIDSSKTLEEWEIPREPVAKWSAAAKDGHAQFWALRIARQKEIDASIAGKAEYEYLYDKPYEDKKKVRVAGPFTVESLSPHRTLGVGPDDELIDPADKAKCDEQPDFAAMILENLRTAGVQQAHKEDKINFTSLTGWPGTYICAEGRYAEEDGTEKRAGIFIGPEFGTVGRQDLVTAAREAGDANFDVLIACAFNYEALASEFSKLGRIPVLKARMNAELHMGTELKNTGKGNLFVIFGEPDITILPPEDAPQNADLKDFDLIRVRINGVDVFHPNTGEVRSNGADGIACWFIDTDYNEESFFVRQAYFLGANDPYKSLKTTLKAEINEDAWASLNSDVSRAFVKPKGGKIAVKVINHLGDEVMKVFRVE